MSLKTLDMEVALSRYFNYRQNLVVPNVSWGMYFPEFRQCLHECDILVCTPSNYLWECEIKVSKADLIKDKEKKHGHYHPAIRRLYFAIPETLTEFIQHIPKRAGIILVKKRTRIFCEQIRKPRQDKGVKISDKQRLKLSELGCMRIWGLKQKLVKK